MKPRCKKYLLKFVGICLVAVAAVFVYRQFVYFPAAVDSAGSNKLSVDFAVERGESVRSIAFRLEEIGIIRDDWVLINYLRQNDLDTKVEAGHFNFHGGEIVAEVAETLLAGQTKQLSFTVLEGWNSSEIDTKLAAMGLIQSGDFSTFVREGGGTAGNEPGGWATDRPVASLEGYLFPATYKIDPLNFSVDNLVARMLSAMKSNLNELGFDPANSGHDLHAILTMASIVELEENSEENRPKVADILWRRLESGLGLYADSTLFYVLGHKKNLVTADFQIDSPYNTRKYRDLPPTPICSPSRSSLNAALHPDLNEYWYYLHDAEGQIHFARTLDEHNVNKAEYLQ
ncbi:MAG: endolytic transglycosylase MltG [Candidatus Peribacteraceae bacterium]|nr:endolytic transglycosylase MltG [Candidatus Peribacteraceae bacterium]